MQVLLATVLIDALHAALENREEAFNRIRVDRAASLLPCGAVHRFVRSELFASLV